MVAHMYVGVFVSFKAVRSETQMEGILLSYTFNEWAVNRLM